MKCKIKKIFSIEILMVALKTNPSEKLPAFTIVS